MTKKDNDDNAVSLGASSAALVERITKMVTLAKEYHVACAEYDQFVTCNTGKVDDMYVVIKARKEPTNRIIQYTFDIMNTDRDPLGQMISKRMLARCEELYTRLQKMKEEI